MVNFLQELKELECAGPKSIVNKHLLKYCKYKLKASLKSVTNAIE